MEPPAGSRGLSPHDRGLRRPKTPLLMRVFAAARPRKNRLGGVKNPGWNPLVVDARNPVIVLLFSN